MTEYCITPQRKRRNGEFVTGAVLIRGHREQDRRRNEDMNIVRKREMRSRRRREKKRGQCQGKKEREREKDSEVRGGA